MSPFFGMCILNLFCHSFISLFHSLVSLDIIAAVVNFNIVQLVIIFMVIALVPLRNLCLLQDHETVFLYFILEALLCYLLHWGLKLNDAGEGCTGELSISAFLRFVCFKYFIPFMLFSIELSYYFISRFFTGSYI